VREVKTQSGEHGSIHFIGTATVLIQCGGFTILTDPTFVHMHEQVSIGYGMYTTRLTNPAVEITELPPLDLVLLSHFHGDHFDQVAERELDKSLPIVTTAEAARQLSAREFSKIPRLWPRGHRQLFQKKNSSFGSRQCRVAMVRRFQNWSCLT
jgi:L-ascorbate metabolism protein UlaG (beta-lactamase superfamily)